MQHQFYILTLRMQAYEGIEAANAEYRAKTSISCVALTSVPASRPAGSATRNCAGRASRGTMRTKPKGQCSPVSTEV